MKSMLPVLLVLAVASCSDSPTELTAEVEPSSTPAASGGSTPSTPSAPEASPLPTDPSELPSDEKGLATAYAALLERAVAILEGVGAKKELQPALDKIAALGPSFDALMKRSEELGLPVEGGGLGDTISALGDRMEKAVQELVKKFPLEAMNIMNAFTDLTGGVGGR